jgi:hypothetical protein
MEWSCSTYIPVEKIVVAFWQPTMHGRPYSRATTAPEYITNRVFCINIRALPYSEGQWICKHQPRTKAVLSCYLIGQSYHKVHFRNWMWHFDVMLIGMGELNCLKKNLDQSHLVHHKFCILTRLYREVHSVVYSSQSELLARVWLLLYGKVNCYHTLYLAVFSTLGKCYQ